jgi:hypothetical protein
VREQLLSQIVTTGLYHAQDQTRIAPNPLAGPGGHGVLAGRDGVLHDVRLGALWRTVHQLNLAGDERIDVPVGLEDRVHASTALLLSPRAMSRWERWAFRRAFRIRSGRVPPASALLVTELDRVRQQGLAAVRGGDEVAWRELSSLLEYQLLEFPRSVSRLGISFDGPVSSPGLFGYGPSRRIFDVFHEVLEQAVREGVLGVINNVMYVPLIVASEASKFDAPALVSQASEFLVHAYARVRRSMSTSDPEGRRMVESQAVDHLFDLVGRVGGHALAYDPLDEAGLARAKEHVRRSMGAVQSLFRLTLTAGDREGFDAALRGWSEVIEHWDYWDHTDRGAAQRAALADMAEIRVALGAWGLYHLFRAGDPPRRGALQYMVFRLLDPLSPEELTRSFRRLADREGEIGGDVGWWYYDDEEGGVQNIDASNQLSVALVVGLCIRAERGSLSMPDQPWIGWRYEVLHSAIDQVRTDPALYGPAAGSAGVPAGRDMPDEEGAPPAGDFRSALERVEQALRDSRDREVRAEAARVREAKLDPDLVAEFRAAAAEAAADQRVMRGLVETRGSWRSVAAPEWQGRHIVRFADKRFYTGDPSYMGQQAVARQMGRTAGLSELTDVVESLAHTEPVVGDDPRAGVRDAIRDLRRTGAQPGLVVCPVSWELLEHLGLALRGGPTELGGAGVPPDHQEKFNGVIDGVPVLDHPSLSDRILVIDLAALLMEEEPTADSSGVEPSVTAIDPDMAKRMIADNPELLRDGKAQHDVVEELRGKVRLEVRLAWRISVTEPALARAVAVPPELQRG